MGLNLLVAVGRRRFAARTGGSLIGQLRRLQTHAQAIGRGDFGHVAETGGVSELAELATAFNQMGAEVRAAQDALEAANAALEDRVRQRTAELAATIQRLEQTERELRTASLYARGLIEASLDPLVTISPEGKITDVNEATEAATGVPRSQLIGTDFSSYFTEPDLARDGYRQVLVGRLGPGLSVDDPPRLRPHDRRALQRRRLQERGRGSAGRVCRRPRRDRAKAGRRASRGMPSEAVEAERQRFRDVLNDAARLASIRW